MKAAKGVTNDVELDADDLKQLVVIFKKIYEDNEHKPFPQDPNEQLIEAVKAVFRSWDNPRANVYRQMNEIPYEWGTAVNVQQMAFGNSGDRSGTGVAFTRDPATGAKRLMGEYLINAQGEDVVAGVRTPSPISHLQDQMPEVYDEFVAIANRLEHYFQDMQDMEFTIEDGKLYMLQTRNGKRTAQAALQIACDLVDEGMITEREAVLCLDAGQSVAPGVELPSEFLSGGSLHVRFEGKIRVEMGDYIHTEFASDGERSMWWSSYFIEQAPTFRITAVEPTRIINMTYKASKM